MAVTKGQKNPNWTREETILALDLFFDCGDHIPGPKDQRVIDLSNLLRSLPYHIKAIKEETFRNPVGVALKLQNLRSFDSNTGMKNASKMDNLVWNELGKAPAETKRIAKLIKENIELHELIQTEVDNEEDEEFYEGRLSARIHRQRERSPQIRKKLLKKRKEESQLRCDICDSESPINDPALIEAVFEAHHIIPLSKSKEVKTKLKDMALLCANCHRILHKLISVEKKWISIDEARMQLNN